MSPDTSPFSTTELIVFTSEDVFKTTLSAFGDSCCILATLVPFNSTPQICPQRTFPVTLGEYETTSVFLYCLPHASPMPFNGVIASPCFISLEILYNLPSPATTPRIDNVPATASLPSTDNILPAGTVRVLPFGTMSVVPEGISTIFASDAIAASASANVATFTTSNSEIKSTPTVTEEAKDLATLAEYEKYSLAFPFSVYHP